MQFSPAKGHPPPEVVMARRREAVKLAEARARDPNMRRVRCPIKTVQWIVLMWVFNVTAILWMVLVAALSVPILLVLLPALAFSRRAQNNFERVMSHIAFTIFMVALFLQSFGYFAIWIVWLFVAVLLWLGLEAFTCCKAPCWILRIMLWAPLTAFEDFSQQRQQQRQQQQQQQQQWQMQQWQQQHQQQQRQLRLVQQQHIVAAAAVVTV